IKVFNNGVKSFMTVVQEIKDVEVNPADPRIMVCATKDRVYLTRDQGRTWTNAGGLPYVTNGIKAVAAAFMPELTLFLSHSVYGVYYRQIDVSGSTWTQIPDGLEKLETTNNPDEISDIAVYHASAQDEPVIYISQTFRRRIYKLNWARKVSNLIWSDDSPFGTVDSLYPYENDLYFLYEGNTASINMADSSMRNRPEINEIIHRAQARSRLNCIVIDDTRAGHPRKLVLNEIWLIDEPRDNDTVAANNKEGFYIPVNHAMNERSLRPYLDTIRRAGLNMIVIDMKDDYGRLRFTPNNSAISSMGRVFNPINLDAFLADMKARGIFTVARVVVFKDEVLAGRENGRFAVWDSRNSRPWQGYTDTRRRSSSITDSERNNSLRRFFPTDDPEFEIVRSFFDENWVDPYSEVVWEYIAQLSIELHERGFDEIQYDYIRFPTDGQNLGDARYRWHDTGMDMESAILSFLRHVRSRVTAPISIDIYGANGWYRTGARTGQEVELLTQWVDVICPMYYPSHFEQYFLAQPPAEMRPWRIYYIGTLRTMRISRGQVVIRPWAQAFYLNVSYDRQYYNPDYIRRQIEGTREAGTGGFTYWNNMGRYDDLPNRIH
ncbi:MAG: hypothetical protein FWB83_03350, partial [Treponema sp.]|nr:hypothetical protein [Treponema sp.]